MRIPRWRPLRVPSLQCGHVSGLRRGCMTAGPDGFAEQAPNTDTAARRPAALGVIGVWDRLAGLTGTSLDRLRSASDSNASHSPGGRRRWLLSLKPNGQHEIAGRSPQSRENARKCRFAQFRIAEACLLVRKAGFGDWHLRFALENRVGCRDDRPRATQLHRGASAPRRRSAALPADSADGSDSRTLDAAG